MWRMWYVIRYYCTVERTVLTYDVTPVMTQSRHQSRVRDLLALLQLIWCKVKLAASSIDLWLWLTMATYKRKLSCTAVVNTRCVKHLILNLVSCVMKHEITDNVRHEPYKITLIRYSSILLNLYPIPILVPVPSMMSA